MPMHDWAQANRSLYHSFYLSWVTEIGKRLNNGVLPAGYFALNETIRDGRKPAFEDLPEPKTLKRRPDRNYIAQEPPQTWHHAVCPYPEYAERAITIRRSDHHGVIGAVRIVVAETKRSRYRLGAFVAWAVEVLRDGLTLFLVDPFPPGPLDPQGIHKCVWDEFMDDTFALPKGKTVTVASYLGRPVPEAYVEATAIGDDLPDIPLFLDDGSHVLVPLESSYRDVWEASPEVMRMVVETSVMPEVEAD